MRREQDSRKERRSKMAEKARERAERNANRRGGGSNYLNLPPNTQFFKAKAGRNAINIIPYKVTADNHPDAKKGDLWYQRTIWVHFKVGAEEKAVLCPKTIGKRCPICKAQSEMRMHKDADPEAIKALRAKERELFNVIDANDADKGVQLWEISSFLFGQKLEQELRDLEDGDDAFGFAELKGGKTLHVRFAEESMGANSFLETSRIDFKDRADLDESILDDTVNLDTILNVMDYDALEKLFLGVEDEAAAGTTEEEEEEDDIPLPPMKKAKAAPPPEDDEEGEEEDEPPAKPSRRRAAPVETDDEDDEEDEPPAKPAKAKTAKGGCPHGSEFGKDCNELTECEECKEWDACQDAQDELNKAKRVAKRK